MGQVRCDHVEKELPWLLRDRAVARVQLALPQVAHDTAQVVHEVLRLPDVAWYCFVHDLRRQEGGCDILTDGLRYGEASHEPLVLRTELLCVRLLLAVDGRCKAVQVPRALLEVRPREPHSECVDAHVVDIVGFVEHHDAVSGELLGDHAGDAGVEHVLVGEDNNIGELDHLAGKEVRAPVLLVADLAEVLEGVDAVELSAGALFEEVLVELAALEVGVLAHPRHSEVSALAVYVRTVHERCSDRSICRLCLSAPRHGPLRHPRVDAEVLPGRQRNAQHLLLRLAQLLHPVGQHALHLLHHLADL
mmetsp:Transcript_13954/g.55063  ORF Transcript_13954/g.55063 Transcript_13954/m.55063 type:complete len:305 (-) Transcript_13954:282-1196(-)